MPGADLSRAYTAVRNGTRTLAEPLSAEDCGAQSMPDASPVKWHLAHTTWFFETFVLERVQPGYRVFHPRFRVLFNSYYNSVGDQHARPERGALTRPSLDEVMAYRDHVDEHVAKLFGNQSVDAELGAVIELGLHHEQQHQELILTDIKHLFSRNSIEPVYSETGRPPRAAEEVAPLRWHAFEEGLRWIGHTGDGFGFDNEFPRHRAQLHGFEIASRAVTNGEWRAFMDDGGYTRPELWLSDGWTTVQSQGWRAPLYWRRDADSWQTHTLHGVESVRDDEPVCHVSHYEADAYASWAQARLPTEFEWEVAASGPAVRGNFVESQVLHPAPARADAGDSPAQLFGDVWEWTSSPYTAYPGFRPAAGALGEYNGKFMSSQMILRGGSCVSPEGHLRATYRNFFQPYQRWQFSGVRLARDVS
jgi:ergothioneine biosynthesis protein EgtB